MLIVIDGYNLIFAIPELENLVKADNIEDAREKLISIMAKYKQNKKYNVVLVFDSSHDCRYDSSRKEISGFEIVYARYNKDADTEIKNMIDHYQNPKDTCVVTNDKDIRRYVQKKGSNLINPEDFYKEVIKVISPEKKKLPKEPASKIKGPSMTETEYWLDVFKNVEINNVGINNKEILEKEINADIDILNDDSPNGEPFSKYSCHSEDETEYWLRFFDKKQDDKNK